MWAAEFTPSMKAVETKKPGLKAGLSLPSSEWNIQQMLLPLAKCISGNDVTHA